MTLKNRREHLVSDVPNNFITRWLVKKFVKKMNKSNSRWTLTARYRKPYKDYMYNKFGDLVPRKNMSQDLWPPTYKRGRVFSLYLRTRRVKGDIWR